MSCVHGLGNRFENEDSGCQNPIASTEFKVKAIEHNYELSSVIIIFGGMKTS